jgi:deoxycytidylate deaminase
MSSPKGDPTYIKNKDRYFIDIAKAVALGSTHPTAPGGCVIVRGREIIGDGRSLLTDSKVEVDCLSYAIAASAKAGIGAIGSVIYSTRYPFSSSVFQAHLMGISRIVILAHEWETFYKDEFRRAARLAREVSIAIEPIFFDEDPRFTKNTYDERNIDPELFPGQSPFEKDEYDPTDATTTHDEDTTTL